VEDIVSENVVLPISYPKFPQMAEKGDTIYLGRYAAARARARGIGVHQVALVRLG
jgi:hypothetical protein